jgi:outer membrane protein OmpA-like peptidoglycan-associated protein
MTRGVLLSFLAVAVGCGGSPMSLRRVVLYQNGVGYFERSGEHDGRLTLRLRAFEIDDVLKSLTVVDEGGETVSAIVPNDLAEADGDESVRLDLVLASRRGRRALVAYTTPAPAWRAAYRIVLPESGRGEGEGVLQAWAVVYNVSDEDWEGVELTLATSGPLTYAVDLRTPRFVARPDVSGNLVTPVAIAAVEAEESSGPADDGDGIAAADDLCPADAEDRDGYEDADGCPDPDNDQDRILDRDDSCPNEPETYNGSEDEDGCPDRGRIVIEESSITILDKIYFRDGSSAIDPQSRPIVEAIAATLRGNPQIRMVEVRGHAGPGEANGWAISAERAAALRAALVALGVEPDRLTVRAFGDSQPLDSSRSADGRARNRRAELQILDAGQDAPPPPSAGTPPLRITQESMAAGGGSAAVADVAGGTEYRLSDRVDVPARSSALVSILTKRVAAESVLLFRPDPAVPRSATHPFRAARLRNDTGAELVPGTLAVFAEDGYLGEGLLSALAPGRHVFAPVGVDHSTTVRSDPEPDREPVRILAVVDGEATLLESEIRRTRYEVVAGPRVPARIFIRHERTYAFGEARDLPPGTEENTDAYLVPVPVTAGRTSHVVIEERRPVERRVLLASDLRTDLLAYFGEGTLPEETAARLRAALEVRAELLAVQVAQEEAREALDDASMRSAELRQSLAALSAAGPRAAELRRTLVGRLEEAVARTEELSRAIAERTATATELRARLTEALRALRHERPAATP